MPNWISNFLRLKYIDGLDVGATQFREWINQNTTTSDGNVELDFSCTVPQGLSADVDWNIANWGCKWNASETHIDESRCLIIFSTPWTCPYDWICASVNRYPELEFNLKWYDEDFPECGSFQKSKTVHIDHYYSGDEGEEFMKIEFPEIYKQHKEDEDEEELSI